MRGYALLTVLVAAALFGGYQLAFAGDSEPAAQSGSGKSTGSTDDPSSSTTNGTTSGGTSSGGTSTATVRHRAPRPFPGFLMIADRGNDRALLVDGRKQILWRYPRPGHAP